MDCNRYACECGMTRGMDVFVSALNQIATIIATKPTENDHIIVELNGRLYGGPKEAFMRV